MLPLMAGGASAQTFLDPADPCIGPVPAASFTDRGSIPEVHRLNVDCAAREGITRGQTSTLFHPAGTVTRGQMASFIARTLQAGGHQLPAPGGQFRDIAGNTHETAIRQLAAAGIVLGVTPERYAPNEPVRRDQMASYLVRAANFAYEGDDLASGVVAAFPFSDVPEVNVHRANIAAAAELLGVTVGVSADRYAPAAVTTRAQMATFVIRLLDVTLIPEPR